MLQYGRKIQTLDVMDTPEDANELRYKVLDSWHQSHVLKTLLQLRVEFGQIYKVITYLN